MNRLYVFPTALILGGYLITPAFAQHRGGFGGGAGKSMGGMPSSSAVGVRGHSGREAGSPVVHGTKADGSTQSSALTEKKTAADQLTQNTKLSSNLQGLLPSGTNVQDAAKGFDNLGQFVAAVHVSHNLSIPFDQLKTEMMNGNSLGQAIHKLKPNVDENREAIKANDQASIDMNKSKATNKAVASGN